MKFTTPINWQSIRKIILFFVILILISGAVTMVDEGERVVVTRFGNLNRVMQPGINLKIPFIEEPTIYEVRTQKVEASATSASKDLQTVETVIALNFNVMAEKVSQVYTDIGKDYMRRIIEPSIQEAIKASTANFNAEALITKRTEVRDDIFQRLKERLERRGLYVSDVAIVDFRFSREFDRAIEAKVTAEQRALEAENKLRQVEFEAQQRIEEAKGEAEAIRIQAEAITQQGGRDYVNLQWISAWKAGGAKVPQIISGDSGNNFLFDIRDN